MAPPTRFTEPDLTSPTAKMPEMFDSSAAGTRVCASPAAAFPVRTKQFASSANQQEHVSHCLTVGGAPEAAHHEKARCPLFLPASNCNSQLLASYLRNSRRRPSAPASE